MGRRRGELLSTDLRIIARDVGSLLLMEAVLMTVTAVLALGFQEFHAPRGVVIGVA
jgi:trk system potassium uptake protein TrkH